MKKHIFLMLLLTAVLLSGCSKEEAVPAISRTTLKSSGPDFAEIQSRIYLIGDSPITRSGACWVLKSTVPYDEQALEFATIDNFVQESETKEPGLFQMRITPLDADTVYYIRFFAQNNQGLFYSYPVRVKTSQQHDDLSFVEVGTFSMGNATGAIDEMPIHKVELEGNFYISNKEITNAAYCEFLNSKEVNATGISGSEQWIEMSSPDVLIEYHEDSFVPKEGAEHLPAICVTWYGSSAYCRWRGGRLPSESEWEFVAKGGLAFDKFKYAGSDNADEVGWFQTPSLHVGGEKSANALAIFDLSGNVAEWCNDWYAEKGYENVTGKNPEGPKSGTAKVIRGGDYHQEPMSVTARSFMKPETASKYVGFRVVVK